MKDPATILHIATVVDWAAAQIAGHYTARSLHTEGFIHCSLAHQIEAVANARFRSTQELVLLSIDAERLTAEVRFENCEGGDEAFPHVYGPIELGAVTDARPFVPRADGRFVYRNDP